ncbi:MAG TPA: tetratricopeptide repeat protein, partial [Bacteroidia bacterium]|nr:tetratricopeptide repeat protein [Bacteroidia bacterium]
MIYLRRPVFIFLSVLFLFPWAFIKLNAGNPVDSLRRVLQRPGPDTSKINALNKLGWEMFLTGEYPRTMDYTSRAIAISKMTGYEPGLAEAYNIRGVVFSNWGNYNKALDNYLLSLEINEKRHNERNVSRNLMNIGIVNMYQENYPKALDYFSRSLASNEKRNDKAGIASNLSNMALVNKSQGKYEKALEYYRQSLKICEEIQSEHNMASNLLNMGMVFKAIGDSAISRGDEALARKNFELAMSHYLQALKIQEKNSDIAGMAYAYGSIGDLYILQKKYDAALDYISQAMKFAGQIASPELTGLNHNAFAKVYKLTGDFKSALWHKEEAVRISDSIYTSESAKTLLQKEMEFEYSKKEAAIQAASKAEQEKIRAIAAAEKRKQQLISTATGIGLILVFLFSVFMYNRYRVTQRQKKIIQLQKHEVEEKNREIQDSIVYAQRLQKAILPPQEYMDTFFPENFVLYKPKDIVAGDFYWLENVNADAGENNSNASGDYTLVAVADSTGHGVPGAMVSVVCSNALNRAVHEFGLRDTGEILDKTTDIVLETFVKSDEDIKDGMDISLLAVNKKDNTITWSGANNSLWYIVPGD